MLLPPSGSLSGPLKLFLGSEFLALKKAFQDQGIHLVFKAGRNKVRKIGFICLPSQFGFVRRTTLRQLSGC